MQPVPFIAASAEEAVAQIRERLGPEAVVLHVRPLPANGIARLWQKPMIEVLAHVPEAPAVEPPPLAETLAEFRQQLHEIKQQVADRATPLENTEPVGAVEPDPAIMARPDLDSRDWRVGAILEKSGLLPLHAQAIVDQLTTRHGERPPASLTREIALARDCLTNLWRRSRPVAARSRHVFVGPAGSGKTTALCKWLTQTALVEGRMARVWRLDGPTANMAESLSVYCEILGVPIERSWPEPSGALAEDMGFIDLPGVDWRSPLAMKELAKQLRQFGSPHVHLVLNAAYDLPVLLAQTRAFAALPVEDLVLTHLDEAPQWGRLWNLVLGTDYSIRWLSTGQNIPGDFSAASPEIVLARQFARK